MFASYISRIILLLDGDNLAALYFLQLILSHSKFVLWYKSSGLILVLLQLEKGSWRTEGFERSRLLFGDLLTSKILVSLSPSLSHASYCVIVILSKLTSPTPKLTICIYYFDVLWLYAWYPNSKFRQSMLSKSCQWMSSLVSFRLYSHCQEISLKLVTLCV